MHWQTEQELELLAEFRGTRRHREELRADLIDFTTIFWETTSKEQRTWAQHMIKSIEEELYRLDD